MKNVFFVNSPSELTLFEKNYGDETILFSANLDVLNAIKNTRFSRKFLELTCFKGDYYSSSFWKKESQAVELTQKILNELVQLMPTYRDYILPLQNRLEMVFLECIETYLCFRSIEQKYNPKKYIRVKKNINTMYSLYDQFSTFVETLFVHYVPEWKKEILLQEESIGYTKKIIHSLRMIQSLSLSSFPVVIRRLLPSKYLDKSDIVLFSSGKNLLFYEKLIHIFEKNYPKTKLTIVTGFQTIEDERLLRTNGIQFVPLDSLVSKLNTTLISDRFTSFLRIYSIHAKKGFESFEKEDIPLRDALLSSLDTVIKNYSLSTIKQTALAKAVLDNTSPSLVITTHDPGPSAMPFALAAEKKNIESLVLMHGWQDTILGVNHQSHHIAVWGPYIKKWYEKKLKKPSETVHALGYPQFDELFQQKKSFWQQSKPQKKYPKTLRLSILITMYLPTSFHLSLFLDSLFQTFKDEKNLKLSLRLHPGQKIEGIAERSKMYDLDIDIDKKTDITEYIKKSDIILSLDTTAIIWCMILGKPLFYCAPDWALGITPINELGGAWIVRSAEDLREKIAELRTNSNKIKALRKSQKKYLKEIVGILDGTSSEKHAKLIYDLSRPNVLENF